MATPAWRSIHCGIGELNLAVLGLGQSFRWRKIESGGEAIWQGVMGNRVWQLKRSEEEQRLYYRVLAKFSRAQSKDDDETVVRDYFQLDTVESIQRLYSEWSLADPHFSTVAQRIGGIRVLRQDPVECLFSFICSTNNNIKRITGMVETLSRLYGEAVEVDMKEESSLETVAKTTRIRKRVSIDDNGDQKRSKIDQVTVTAAAVIVGTPSTSTSFYDFPTVISLAEDNVEATLRTNGFGYRAKYIAATAKMLLREFKDESGVSMKLNDLRHRSDRKEAVDFLLTLQGVGPKVADCVALMSLDKTDAVPIDTHVRQITAEKYMPELKKAGSLTLKLYDDIGAFYRKLFGTYAGWAHSVLFSAQVTRE